MGINKWRLFFLVFTIIYSGLILLDLTKTPVQWDEVIHLNDGLFLLRGEYKELNYFYPPLFDGVIMIFFRFLEISVYSGRLVSVVFSLLSIWVVFELAYRMYGAKTALISSILLGIFPGYFWLSRLVMIETMLVFFFTVSIFFFFSWLTYRKDKLLFLSGLALGFGFLTKYQILIAGVIMVVSGMILTREHFRLWFSKFILIFVVAATIIIPWILVSYQTFGFSMLDNWIYALQIGNPSKALYSVRYPFPLFYFIEIVWPYSDIHPISLFLYIISLFGLGLFAWRRKKEDKMLLIWFAVVFIFFTLIPNKHWRYVLPLFPVLAISAASFIFFFYEKTKRTWRGLISINKKRGVKVAAGLFTLFLATGIFFSTKDAYDGVAKSQINIDIEGATEYVCNNLNQNESIMLLCPFNLFNKEMVRFYLWAEGTRKNQVYQYPELPVDTYKPNFNITEFIGLCKQHNVRYVFTYEFGGVVSYFNTTLNLQKIYMMLYDSNYFTHITDNATFGVNPRRIFILNFLG